MILLAGNFQEPETSLLPYCFHDKLAWKHTRKSKQKMYAVQQLSGAPEGIRTPDPQIRSLVLYPAELPALKGRAFAARLTRIFHRYFKACPQGSID